MNSLQQRASISPLGLRFYSTLRGIRPSLCASLLKELLGVRRRLTRLSSGRSFWVDPASEFGLSLLSSGSYEPHMTRLLSLVLRPGDVFLDIGGNEGYFSVMAASLDRPVRVFCFEPQARLQKVIQKNLAVNRASGVSVHRLALADQAGEVELFRSSSVNSGSSSLFVGALPRLTARLRWLSREKVPCTTVDAFLRENRLDQVRLAKIDCEGAEGLVIRGARQALQDQRIDFIALEYHLPIIGGKAGRELDRFLHSCGYILTWVRERTIYHLPGLEEELRGLGDMTVGAKFLA